MTGRKKKSPALPPIRATVSEQDMTQRDLARDSQINGLLAQAFDNDVDLRRVIAARVDPHHRVPSGAAPRAAG